MPILAYRPEEMLLLSSLCVKPPNELSPMRRHFIRAPRISSPETAANTIKDLLSRGQLFAGGDGKIHLDPNIQPLFWILNSPEQVISFSRFAQPDMAECYFCSSGSLWVQDAVNFNEKVELVLYPFTWENVRTWFCDDLLKDVTPGAGSSPAQSFDLHMAELLLLLAVQEEYGSRVLKVNRRLEPKELWVGLDQLSRRELLDALAPVGSIFMPVERFRAFLGDRDLLQKIANGLSRRGFLQESGGSVRFAETGKRFFDPGRMLACLTTKTFGKTLRAKVLYVFNDGGLLLEESPGQELAVRASWIPGSAGKAVFFDKLTDGLVVLQASAPVGPRKKPAIRKAVPKAPPAAAKPVMPTRPTPPSAPPSRGEVPPTIFMTAPELPPLRLVIESGLQAGSTVELKANTILGRLEGSGLWVNDPRVSRRHAEFRRALDGSWTLTDLKSANGTFINDTRLQETSTLKPGDRIRVAETVFVVAP